MADLPLPPDQEAEAQRLFELLQQPFLDEARRLARLLAAKPDSQLLGKTEFEVDIASQGTKAFNPLTEETDVVLYDPLDGRYQRSKVIDLFRRLPVRISLCRIFARDDAQREALVAAADRALAR